MFRGLFDSGATLEILVGSNLKLDFENESLKRFPTGTFSLTPMEGRTTGLIGRTGRADR